MFGKLASVLAAASLVIGAGGVARATTILKIGTVAPQDSSWGREFKRLTKEVADDTGGELVLDFQWNGQAGDETLMVQKIRTGQLDAAAVSALGLGATGVTDIFTLELPGLFSSWAKLDTARDAMKDEFTRQFANNGFTILGWGDAGAAKTMSVGVQVHRPTDLQGKSVFFFSGDAITPRLYAAIGGITAKPLSIMEVLPAMTAGAINVLTGPPIVAEQLQWASRVTDLDTETVAYVVGGLIASSARLQSLPPNLRQVVLTRAAQSADRLNKTIRNIDAQAFARMKATKKIYVPTEAERQEWRAVFTTVAKQLRGAVFTPAVFDRVVQLAGNPLAL